MGNKQGRNVNLFDGRMVDKVLERLRELSRQHGITENEKQEIFDMLRDLKKAPQGAVNDTRLSEIIELLNLVSLSCGSIVGKTPHLKGKDDYYKHLLNEESNDYTKQNNTNENLTPKSKKEKLDKEVDKLRSWLASTPACRVASEYRQSAKNRHRLIEDDSSVDYVPDGSVVRSSNASSGYHSTHHSSHSSEPDMSVFDITMDRTVFESH